MKLALATWNGRVSPVFDVARQVLVFELQDGREQARHLESLPGTDPHAQAERLAALGAQVLICGALSQAMAALLAVRGVRVIPFTAGTVEAILAAWLSGSLPAPAWSMPGCCGRMRGCRGRGAGGQGGHGWCRTQPRSSHAPTRKE
jgi:predicted Fe-Mo cluster-binding NifX family protein